MVYSNHEGDWLWVWNGPITSNTWFDVKVRVKLSSREESGTLQLSINGEPQKFIRNRDGQPEVSDILVCRTLDSGRGNYPKWGAYNREKPLHAMRHYVDLMRIKRIS